MKEAEKPLNYSDLYCLIIILIISVAAMLPVVFCGVPSGNGDFVHHLQISNAFFQSVKNSVFYPNWIMDENLGYGAVTVRFYPPLIQYSLGIFRLFIGNWQWAIFAAFSCWSFVGGAGMYLWAKEILANRLQSITAAILFVLAPYHLNQFYNSFLFGEFAALSILPFAFLFVLRICHDARFISAVGFSVAFASLILSNLPQAVIGSICIGLYFLLNVKRERPLKQFSLFAGSILTALALSAFFWIRLVREMSWINVAQPNIDPNYDYRNHFLLSGFTLDAQGVWFANLILIITVSVILIVFLVSKSYKSFWREKKVLNIALLFIFSLTMTLPLTKFIWNNLDFMQKIQFPWRFLSVLTVCLPILTAYCLQFINIYNWRKHRPEILILAGTILIYSFFSIKQIALGAVFTDGDQFDKSVENISRQKGLHHWLPVWANEQTFDEANPILTENRRLEKIREESENREFFVSEGQPSQIRLPILYYPHWKGFINGKPVAVEKSSDGAIELNLPPEAAEVKLIFAEPFENLAARYISLLTVIFLSAITVCSFFRFKIKLRNEIHY